MLDLKQYEVWFVTGSQHLYGPRTLETVAEHLRDFADIAGIEFILIDEHTRVDDFRDKLRWNDLYYHLSRAL